MRPIRSAAVIGAGTMGTGIAAHLAGAGVRCLLLDIVPPGLPPAELKDPRARSRLATEALKRALQSGAFLDPADAGLVTAGNVDDHLEKLRECDWIIEAIVERLPEKRSLFQRIAPLRRADAVVSSNTSGLSLELLVEGLDQEFQRHFLITHFFNPPRHMYLLEVVPGPRTLPEVVERIEDFASLRLGKGVVRCKDTPNFIANRIGVFNMAASARLMEEEGLSIEEVDAITGRPMGRPRTGSFSLLDLVGIDVAMLVQENAMSLLPGDESREVFQPTALLKRMVAEGRLGRKSGAGFYKKVGKDLLVLDPATFEYRPPRKVEFPSLEAAAKEREAGGRLRALIAGSDRASRYAWRLLSAGLLYSARRIPEIAEDIVSVDRALRWGFNWELGPFEAWDAIGVKESARRMESEGETLPPLVRALLGSGRERFYERSGRDGRSARTYFDLGSRAPRPEPPRPGVILLDDLRAGSSPIRSNSQASLWHLGEGVLCAEFHSKMNTITGETLELVLGGLDELEGGGYRGLVIGNGAENFSAGANLAEILNAAKEKRWEPISGMIRRFHQCALRIRYSPLPVVAAVRGLALGGGLEIPLACHRVQAAAESYLGLVELGVGVIPAGGGTRELACRAAEAVPPGVETDLFPFVRRAFETIGRARTSGSGLEARTLGYLREADGISMNRDRVLGDAKALVLELSEAGFRPPPERRRVRVVGAPGLAELKVIIHLLRSAGEITEHDALVAGKLAHVLCGGEVDDDAPVSEEYLLSLELEAFLSLLGEPKTLERIEHMLKVGKPLRN
jgi:3-hydroxyacyl-CoA dehydrogenase